MALLIDGYNLLHVTGIFGRGSGPGAFQRTREALLRFISASVEEKQRKTVTVVFDASQAPPGLPSTEEHNEMLVRYAKGYPDADTLIEEIIEQSNAPRSLLVISSDHRIQRAARKRGASYLDSETWYEQACHSRRRASSGLQNKAQTDKPHGQLSKSEVKYWLQEFDHQNLEDLTLSESQDRTPEKQSRKPPTEDIDLNNPFPPGYADDLFDE